MMKFQFLLTTPLLFNSALAGKNRRPKLMSSNDPYGYYDEPRQSPRRGYKGRGGHPRPGPPGPGYGSGPDPRYGYFDDGQPRYDDNGQPIPGPPGPDGQPRPVWGWGDEPIPGPPGPDDDYRPDYYPDDRPDRRDPRYVPRGYDDDDRRPGPGRRDPRDPRGRRPKRYQEKEEEEWVWENHYPFWTPEYCKRSIPNITGCCYYTCMSSVCLPLCLLDSIFCMRYDEDLCGCKTTCHTKNGCDCPCDAAVMPCLDWPGTEAYKGAGIERMADNANFAVNTVKNAVKKMDDFVEDKLDNLDNRVQNVN